MRQHVPLTRLVSTMFIGHYLKNYLVLVFETKHTSLSLRDKREVEGN
jgi:hypothetical protein